MKASCMGRLALFAVLAVSSSCGTRPPPSGADTHSTAPLVRQVQAHVDTRRPPLASLTRQGDPAAGLAMVIAHEGDCENLVMLGQVLLARLAAANLDGHGEITPGGLSLAMLASSPESAKQAFKALDQGLRRPLEAKELATIGQAGYTAKLDFSSPLRACNPAPQNVKTSTVVIERERQAAMVRERVAFAIVGAPRWIDAVQDLAPSLEAWPSATPVPHPFAPTELRFTRSRSLSDLTLRMQAANLNRALEAQEHLSDGGLERALRVHFRQVHLSRIEVHPQLFGGVLELEFEGLEAEKAEPRVPERVLALAVRDLRSALKDVSKNGGLSSHVAKERDPRTAAIGAAWSVLSRAVDAPETYLSILRLEPDEPVEQDLATRFKDLASNPAPPPAEPLLKLEPGQANLLALLGTRCPGDAEGSGMAGATALLFESLAKSYTGTDGVRLQAVTGAEGSALLASASPRSRDTSDLDVARRLGRVLGTVMARSPLLHHSIEAARGDLLTSLGGSPRPALWTALESLTPSRTGVLSPRGTFPSLVRLDPSAVEARRRQLLDRGLSLAVLAHSRPEQATMLASVLARHLSVASSKAMACRTPAPEPPGKTRIALSGPRADPADPTLTVAVDLGLVGDHERAFAEWLTWLLDRDHGWLAQAVGAELLNGRPRATLVGSDRRRALLLFVPCAEQDVDEAIGRLERWFDTLSRSPLLSDHVELAARNHFERALALRRLDPGQRLLELWSQPPVSPAPAGSTFRDYLHRALGTAHMVSVIRQPGGSPDRDR